MLIFSQQALRSVFILEKGVFMKKIKNFFKDVKKELSKVKFPTKKNMFKYTLITVLFIMFFALFFFLIDLIVAYIKVLVG